MEPVITTPDGQVIDVPAPGAAPNSGNTSEQPSLTPPPRKPEKAEPVADKKPRGRPKRDAQRVTNAPPKIKAEIKPKNFSAPLSEMTDVAWLGLSMVGMLGDEITKASEKIPDAAGPVKNIVKKIGGAGLKLEAEAAVLRFNNDKLIAGLNLAAQHNKKARAFAEKVDKGGVSWVGTCALMMLPFAIQSANILAADPETVAAYANKNRGDVNSFIEDIQAKMNSEVLGAQSGPVL